MNLSETTVVNPIHKGLRVAVLAAGPTTGVVGGAERLYEGLISGLKQIGCEAELISIPADEPHFEAIMDNYARCEALDVSGYDVVISTKAPTYAVRHPRHVMYLVHTVRVFDDMFEQVFPQAGQELLRQRARIHAKDFEAMTQVKARFAIGHEVAARLYRWRGLDADVLHPPLGVTGFRSAATGDYFFLPGRLHDWKRVDLVVEAIRRSSRPMKLLIAGTGEAEAKLKQLANGDPRIEFLGRVDDASLLELYSHAIAVPFVPKSEDYGYVTLEAFASGKPVVTCFDSGEPARVVVDGESGRVCAPDPDEICKALESLFDNPAAAQAMGAKGQAWIAGMHWPDVAQKLVNAALAEQTEQKAKKLKVTVLDMQPIDPPVGGGRLRLLGLYHNLGDEVECTYIGSYDWPGESYRQHRLSPCLEEIDVPLSAAHHAAAESLSRQAGGKTVIDIAFGRLGHLSPEYLQTARHSVRDADVVVFSHPWVYPLLQDQLRPGQTVVYDSQNVEGFLRAQLLDENNPIEAELLRQVVEDELLLCQRADLVLVCSHEDALRFNRLYRIHANKLRVVPNGVMAFAHPVPEEKDRDAAKEQLGIQGKGLVAIFIGSAYGPNVEAARFISEQLAPKSKETLFVIAGGVGSQITSDQENVYITGQLSEVEKIRWLTAADVAINPMFSGSGTNIKMFDFMAFGLPIISTEIGARGIKKKPNQTVTISSPSAEAFQMCLHSVKDAAARAQRGARARQWVEEHYAWERISKHLGQILKSRIRYPSQQLPYFSVMVVVSGSSENLLSICSWIDKQIERDFELILVDRVKNAREDMLPGLASPLTYIHAPYLEENAAKNLGLSISSGAISVLVSETDAQEPEWLSNLRKSVDVTLIKSGVQAWVTHACQGAGAALPRLVARTEALRVAGGFDECVVVNDLADSQNLIGRLRMLGQVETESGLDTPILAANNQKTIVMLSTVGHKCGVGEYAAALESALENKGISIHAISCRSESAGLNFEILERPVHIGWYYDDVAFAKSIIYPEIFGLIQALGACGVIIQYHPAFYSMAVLSQFVKECRARQWHVIIDNHRYKVEDAPALIKLAEFGAKIHFHRQAECLEAEKCGLNAIHSPIGVENKLPEKPKSIRNRNWQESPPTLVTTGFLRAHKGVRTLIGAMPEIQKKFPGANLRIHCAEYSSEDSKSELIRCRSMVAELNLMQHIVIDTAFREKSEQLEVLRGGDIALLSYEASEEGGSAAASDCLSVGLPLLVSRAKIFDDIRGHALTVDGDAFAWATAIKDVLEREEVYEELALKAVDYVAENNWNKIANYFDRP